MFFTLKFHSFSSVRLLRRLITPLVILVVWHTLVQRYQLGDGFVPSPAEVLQSLREWIVGSADGGGRYSATWARTLWDSASRVLAGFAIAVVSAVPVGLFIGRSRLVSDLLDPVLQILRPIPTSTWIPFSLVFFGIGSTAAISLIAMGAFFPIVLNTTAGARHVSELHLRSARMLGASNSRILLRVVLPAALPSIMVGMRLALGLSWVLVVVSEMVAVKSGLGFELWNAYYYARMDVVVGAMLTVGALGFISDQGIVLLMRRFLFWNKESI